MAALGAKNLESVLPDKLALIVRVINDDLDRLLAPVTREPKIESVGGSFHSPAFL
jgi:hypothetical protein